MGSSGKQTVTSFTETGGTLRRGPISITEGSNVTITDNGDGTFTVAASSASTALEDSARALIENNAYKAFGYLGGAAPRAGANYGNDALCGIGFATITSGSGTIIRAGVGGALGGWAADTAATINSNAGHYGPSYRVNQDPTFVARILPRSAADQSVLIGFLSGALGFSDRNDIIALRITGTGTMVFVSDASGTETTRDTGVTPNGSTEYRVRIVVSGGGTQVDFYLDGSQVGAAVTTNIPSGTTSIYPAVGIYNTAAASKTLDYYDVMSVREV